MNIDKKDNGWIQCQCCGNIYKIEMEIPIDVSMVEMKCPSCGEYTGLNLGNDINDIYLYMNPNVDSRYY